MRGDQQLPPVDARATRADHAPRPLLIGLGWDRPGGLTRYLRDLRDTLEGAGLDTRTLVMGPATDVPGSVTVVADEGDSLLRRLLGYSRAARAERARQHGVVDVHFALFAYWPVRWGALRSLPLVVHFHGPWAGESSSSAKRLDLAVLVKRQLERSLYGRAHQLVVLSQAFKQLLVHDYAVAPWRVRVIRPGVDLVRFSPGRVAARTRLGHGDRQVVFTARRLVERMGLSVLLQAWAQLEHHADRMLLIAGEGPLRASLEQQASALGVASSVRLLGQISDDDLVEHYRAADLCVLPSLSLEGFGLAAVEALACGTPVVTTDVGGLPEVVSGLDGSLVVPADNPSALAARMTAALAGDVPSAERCRGHAETFTWASASEGNQQAYSAAAAEAARRADGARRVRVVYLDHCAELSGAEIALARLIPSLPDVEAHVVLAEDGPLVALLRAQDVSVDVRTMSPAARTVRRAAVRPGRLPVLAALHTATYVLRLAWHLRRLRPDLLHTNSLKAGLYGALAGRLAGVPVVWHVRDRIAEDYLPGPAVRLVRAAIRLLPAAVLANSQATMDTLGPSTGSAVSRTVVGDPYRPLARTAPADRPDGTLVIGMVGRLAPWKGQHVLLQALARLGSLPPTRAVLIGSALFGEVDYEAYLRRLIDDLDLSGRVELGGFHPDISTALAGFDVLVHASVTPEPFGQVVVEGLAAGLPVVASAAGGPAEIIRDGVDGLLYPPGDVDALASVIERLVQDPALRARLGSAGRERAEHYLPEVIGPAVSSVYRKVLAWP